MLSPLLSWLDKLPLKLKRRSKRSIPCRRADRTPAQLAMVESLESRTLLSAIFWDGGAGTQNWNDASNWSGDSTPGAGDDVTINAPGDLTIVHSSGATALHSLVSHESIDWAGGSLSVAADSVVYGEFNNSGTVEVQSDTFTIITGTHTGDFLVGSGATLTTGGFFDTSSDITGPGNLNLYNAGQFGVVNIGGNVALDGATIGGDFAVAGDMTLTNYGATFNGTPAIVGGAATANGHMAGTGDVTIGGLFTWVTGYSMQGTGMTTANGGMHITGSGTSYLERTIENAGVALFDGGTIKTTGGAVLRNLPGASFEIRNDADIEWGGGLPLFDNQGAFLKTTGADVTSVGIDFNNSGTVEVQSGTLALGATYTAPLYSSHTGDFLIRSGAALSITYALFEASSKITGPGNLTIFYATHRGIVDIGGNVSMDGVTIEGDFAVAGDMTLTNYGATFNGTPATVGGTATINGHMSGTGLVTINGLLTWNLNQYQMAGTGTTLANGGMHITGSGTAYLLQRTIENAGVAVFDGGAIFASNGAVIRNRPGASFEIRNDADINNAFSGPFPT
ncbi:MAG: hypothetical protein ACKV0T_17410, partial [Planctomycetales bacterium]